MFTGSVAEVYDTYLVLLIFERYATDLAKRTAALAPEAVLEIAAGSGVVTRGITSMLEPGTRHAVTDLNPPMLEMAASKQPSPGSMDGCGPSSSRHAERKSPCQVLVAQPM
ncbi:MAG: class I SAM-dependent methyltransferase [Acidimicrobiia bacterium]